MGKDLEGKGYSIDPDGLSVAFCNLADGEQKIFDLVDSIRTSVIVEACDIWDDPYGQKLIDAIDRVSTDLDKTLENIKANDVKLKQAANKLLAGTKSTIQYKEVPSMESTF